MKLQNLAVIAAAILFPTTAYPQVKPTEINGWSNSPETRISSDTNVTFTLQMSLIGEDTPRNNAFIGQDIEITAIIRPEISDIGKSADIILVNYLPPSLTMRNTDGDFVKWNGSLRKLEPFITDLTLEN